MKHLLIILSILVLSSPVIGNNHKGETLYAWDISSTRSPEYVWRGFGEEETHPKYIGDVKNGKPNGFGIMIFPNGNKYIGGWKKGRWNGQGTFTTSNGSKYEGESKNGISNGQGTYSTPHSIATVRF